MNARQWLWLAGALAFAGRLAAEDTEVWWTARQRQAWNRSDTLEVFETAKYRDSGSQLSEYFVEGGPVLGLGGGWQVAPWMHVGEVRSDAGWSYELEPSVNTLHRWAGRWVSIATRMRVEYHERGDSRNGWKIRGRLTLAPGATWRAAVKPYLSEEVFDNFRVHRMDQNRLFGGAVFPLGREWSGDVYCGWRSDLTAGRWVHRRIVGLRAGWAF